MQHEPPFTLTEDDRARAAAHVQAAEAAAGVVPLLPPGTPTRPVTQVTVIGAGTMGGGIAMALANTGIAVTLVGADDQALARGLARVRENYAVSVKRGKLSEAQVAPRLNLIHGAVSLDEGRDAGLFIEAVFEDMALKQRLFREIDAVARPGAILATNTSGLDIEAIAAVTHRPVDVVGAHFSARRM